MDPNREFISSDLEVVASANKSLVGVKGTILDETKYTFKLKTGKKTRTILKQGCTFRIGDSEFKGADLLKRSYERKS